MAFYISQYYFSCKEYTLKPNKSNLFFKDEKVSINLILHFSSVKEILVHYEDLFTLFIFLICEHRHLHYLCFKIKEGLQAAFFN